jgi:membrane associated rhomboid family serine protease
MASYRAPGSVPPVIKYLLIINGLVYLAQLYFLSLGYDLTDWGALYDLKSGDFRVWQLITHMFMHDPGNWFHIIFNMFGLWMFGKELENVWGSKRFLQFYFMCGLAAGLAELLLQSHFKAIGASGAVMGVFAGFAYLFPNAPLLIMFIPIPIKAKYAIPGLMLIDLFSGIAGTDNIAHWAHLGGAIAGFVIVYIWNKRNRSNFY